MAMTEHSNKELLANLLAPCKPECDASPMTYKLEQSVSPDTLTLTPPQV